MLPPPTSLLEYKFVSEELMTQTCLLTAYQGLANKSALLIYRVTFWCDQAWKLCPLKHMEECT